MSVLFQGLGITGGILILAGMLAFAFTRASTWFFWGLLIAGGAFVVTFVLTTLRRLWQLMIAMFVALNLPWVLLALGKEWEIWKLGAGAGVCFVVVFLVGFRRAGYATIAVVLGLLAGTFAGAVFLREKSWYGYVVLAAAFLYNGAFLLLGRLALKEMLEKRSLRYGATAVVYSILSIAVIAVANIASQDFHFQKDLTANQVNTLTEQSTKILENLKTPLKITAFFDDRNPMKGVAKDLLEMYGNQSRKVEVKFVDPDKEKILAEKHKAKDGDILIEYESQSHMMQMNPSAPEEGVTQAIMKVARTASSTACFTKGHGELELDASENSPRSLSFLKAGLENEGIQSKSLDSIVGGVASDCSVLVIAGPMQKFTEAEAQAVGRFLETGGKGFFLLDPRIPDPRISSAKLAVLDTGLDEVTKKWGVELGKDFILEAHLELLRGVVTGLNVQAFNYGNHPIVDPLKGKQTVFDNVRSVRKAPGFSGTAVDLIMSAGKGTSWTKSDVDTLFRKQEIAPGPKDLQGPVTFAVAAEKEAGGKKTQLVVIGDSDFLSNNMIRGYEFNFDLALNAFNWLAGTVEQISIRPKRIRTSALDLTEEQKRMVFYVAVITIPMLVLIFGINLWWYRRRKG